MTATLVALTMLADNLFATQQWEYVYDGEVYVVECDVIHLNEAEFVTLDGQVVRIADLG